MQMGKDTSILDMFSKLDNQSSINQLVEKSYKAALAYLRLNCNKVNKIFAENDLTFSEAAISSIAPLFFTDTNDHNLPIVKEFNIWKPPIQSDEDAIYFLNKVIARRVDQYIVHLLKEHDPFFAKILDSVIYLIKKESCKKVSYFGKRYIVQSSCHEIDGKVIDEDSFEKLPTSLFQDHKKCLTNVFIYLEKWTDFFLAIPLNSLVIRLRNLHGLSLNSSNSDFNFSSKFEVNEIVNSGLRYALDKLKYTYCANGKLDNIESESFINALKDMAEDLKDGGINHGLYDYLKQHFNGLEKQDYQNKYHNMLEYLLKVMKTSIRDKIMEEKE